MSLRHYDSFDTYVTADLSQNYNNVNSSGMAISAGNGRRSTASLRFTTSSGNVLKSFDHQSTWIIGFSLRVAALPSTSSREFIVFYDGGSVQVDLRLNAAGQLFFTRGGTTTLASSTNAISANTTYHIQAKIFISDTVGTVELRVNGTNTGWIPQVGSLDTKNSTTNATVNGILIQGAVSSANTDYDDLWICDGQGSAPYNDFLGDLRADVLTVNGAGNSAQFSPTSGGNYTCVDESAPNGDTDVVSSSTVGHKDTYAYSDLAHTPTTIYGVKIKAVVKKDDAGYRAINLVTRSGGADYDSSEMALPSSYTAVTQIRETDPATGVAWTRTNLNAAEFGVKVAA